MSIGAQVPNLLHESFDLILNIIFVLAGIEEDGLEGGSFALEEALIIAGQFHYFPEDEHPSLLVVFEFRVQVLKVEVVK